jgi:hypothetical protein
MPAFLRSAKLMDSDDHSGAGHLFYRLQKR